MKLILLILLLLPVRAQSITAKEATEISRNAAVAEGKYIAKKLNTKQFWAFIDDKIRKSAERQEYRVFISFETICNKSGMKIKSDTGFESLIYKIIRNHYEPLEFILYFESNGFYIDWSDCKIRED